jgi:ribonuclease J
MKLIPVSGFNKVEGNLFYVEDEKSQKGYVLDMGIDVEMALFHKDKPLNLMTREEAIRREIVPNDAIVPKEKVSKILISHAHYDHIGAVPLLERQYNAPILGTHFTIEVLKKLFRDRNERSKNKLVKLRENYIQ